MCDGVKGAGAGGGAGAAAASKVAAPAVGAGAAPVAAADKSTDTTSQLLAQFIQLLQQNQVRIS